MTPEQLLATLNAMMGAGSPMNKNVDTFSTLMKAAWVNQQKLNGLTDKEIKLIEEKLKADDEYAAKVQQRAKNIAEGANKLKDTVTSTVKEFGGLASKVASSADGFTAVVPVVQMLGNTTKGVVEALGKMTSGISVFGFSTGKASEGLSQMAGIGIDLVTSALTQQLEGTQKIVNSYVLMSKAGVTFGGSLEDMKAAAHASGMSIDTFGKFITKNYEQFGSLTGNVTEAATRVGAMSKNISTTNPKILAMYGSMEELGNATADYMSMQARYGVDTTKNTKELTLGATEYLIAQKELTALTGKSSEALKKSEEERQNSAAYQIAMLKMEPQQRENARKAIELIEARYGKEAGKIAMESVARNGDIISQTGLQLGALNPTLIKTIQDMTGMTKQSQVDFSRNSALVMQNNQQAINQEQLKFSEVFKNQVSGYTNPMIDMYQNVVASTLKSQTAQGDAVKTAAQLEEERKKSADRGAKAFASVITQLEDFKIKMDDVFMKRMLTKEFKDMMDSLYKIAEASIKVLDKLNAVMPTIMSGFEKATKALEGIGSGNIKSNVKVLSPKERVDQGLAQVPGAEKNAAGGTTLNMPGGAAGMITRNRKNLPQNQSPAGGGNETPGAGETPPAPAATSGSLKPDLVSVTTKSGKKASVAKQFAPAFQSLLDYFDSVGYEVSDLGGYNDRDVTGKSGVKSYHAYGAAIDVNPKQNPYGPSLITDMPADIGKVAESLGLGWGANWPNVKDAMHFSAAEFEGGKLLKAANGAKIPATDGGVPVLAGEGGRNEVITPISDSGKLFGIDEMIDKLDQMLSVMKDQKYISENILQATA